MFLLYLCFGEDICCIFFQKLLHPGLLEKCPLRFSPRNIPRPCPTASFRQGWYQSGFRALGNGFKWPLNVTRLLVSFEAATKIDLATNCELIAAECTMQSRWHFQYNMAPDAWKLPQKHARHDIELLLNPYSVQAY